jgi:hypothetical protein
LRLKLIACEILCREFCAAVARSASRVDVEFLPKGLHDAGRQAMFDRLRETLARVDESSYDAVLLGYALCGNGLVGLGTRTIPLVVARAHDCITLLLGSRHRYLDYFRSHPGVYFKTSGWIERGEGLAQLRGGSLQSTGEATRSFEQLAAKYGEDNARFLMQQLDEMTHRYTGLTFIETGIEPDDRFEQHARREAARSGWQFEKLAGDLMLVEDLVDGRWDDDRFLLVPPGCRVAPSFDDRIVKAEPDE